MKKPQIRSSLIAVLAAFGATAAMLPVHATDERMSTGGTQDTQSQQGMSSPQGGQDAQGGVYGNQAPTSTHQPEQSQAPGDQTERMSTGGTQDTQSQQGMTSSQGGQDAQGGVYGSQAPTSTHQPEQSQAPGDQTERMSTGGTQDTPSQQGMSSSQGSQDAQGGVAGSQAPTSTHQPEQSQAPGGQGMGTHGSDMQHSRDAQGMSGAQHGGQDAHGGMQGSSQPPEPLTSTHQPEQRYAPSGEAMGMQHGQDAQGMGARMMPNPDQQPLTREQVRAETEAWRQAGLLEMMMDYEDGGAWLDPQVQQMRNQVSNEVHAQRGWSDPSQGTRDAAGTQDATGVPRTEWQQEQLQKWQQQEAPGHPTEGQAGQMPGGFTNQGGDMQLRQEQNPSGSAR